jgi:hypothetical protein
MNILPKDEGGEIFPGKGIVGGVSLDFASRSNNSRDLFAEEGVGVIDHLLILERGSESEVRHMVILSWPRNLNKSGVNGVARRVDSFRSSEEGSDR